MYISVYQLCFTKLQVSRDFFKEKQSYLLTEFPLFKYERETTPFTLLSHKKELSDHAHLNRTDKVENQQ